MQVVKQNNTMNTNQYTTQSKNQNDQYCMCSSPEWLSWIVCVIFCFLKIILSDMCISLNNVLYGFFVFEFKKKEFWIQFSETCLFHSMLFLRVTDTEYRCKSLIFTAV